MEGLFAILGLLVLLYLLLMPAFAWFKASSTEKEIGDLRALVNELRALLWAERLPQETVDAVTPEPASQAEPEPVAAMPPLSEKLWLPCRRLCRLRLHRLRPSALCPRFHWSSFLA